MPELFYYAYVLFLIQQNISGCFLIHEQETTNRMSSRSLKSLQTSGGHTAIETVCSISSPSWLLHFAKHLPLLLCLSLQIYSVIRSYESCHLHSFLVTSSFSLPSVITLNQDLLSSHLDDSNTPFFLLPAFSLMAQFSQFGVLSFTLKQIVLCSPTGIV